MRRIEVIVTVHVESHNKFFSDLHLGHIKFFELLLKKEAKENDGYKQLFEMLYGDMPKYGGGGFKL